MNSGKIKVTIVRTLRDYLLGLEHDTIGSVNFREFMKRVDYETIQEQTQEPGQ